jgi:hypothetical protein
MSAGQDINAARRLVIHCGVQKTATTSLHHFAARNRGLLLPQLEVLTPAKGTRTQKMGRAAMLFSLDPSPENKDRFVALIGDLRDHLLEGSGPVLVSHENLPGAMIGKGGVVTLYPMLERIIALLETYFAPLVPDYAFYTRDMMAWKKSVHNQAVKSDHYPHSWTDFQRETKDCGTWDALESRMHAIVGADRTRFFRMEDEGAAGRPALQLLRFAGVTDDVIDALTDLPNQRNQSLNSGSLEFLRKVNALGLERGARRKVAELVQQSQPLFATAGASR